MTKISGTFVGTGEWDDATKTFTMTGAPTSPPSPPVSPPASGFQLGDRPFSEASSWNVKIPQNANLKNLNWPASTGYNYIAGWNNYTPAIEVASDADPVVQVTHPDGWGYPAGTVEVRIKQGVSGAGGTDGELLAIDGEIVHNFWQFVRDDDTHAHTASYAACNVMTDTGWGTQEPFKAAGIMAVGASMLAGLLVKKETDKGVIPHALQLTLDRPLVKPGKTGEAINSDGGSSSGIVQEADRLAIPRSTAKPSGLSPLGQAIFVALQEYGGFVCDVSDMCSKIRMQLNDYDQATADALTGDLGKIFPLLKKVG